MVGNRNFSVQFANAMLAATPPSLLANEPKTATAPGTAESMARLERELAALQLQTSIVQDSYGPDVFDLTVIKDHLAKWLSDVMVIKWLARFRPEYLNEFQMVVDTMDIATP